MLHPRVDGANRPAIIDHDLKLSARTNHPHQFAEGLFGVRRGVQHAERIAKIKRVGFKRKIFCIRHLNALRSRQIIHFDAMSQVIQSLLSQIDPGSARADAQPLDEISARAKTNFQHFFSMIAAELRKAVNVGLVEIAVMFKFIKIGPGKFFRMRVMRIAACLVTKVPNM